ncbi:unnamed protein product (macronuclear) [Paramecium tetraurelia]|uniref:RING-type domain-containing protein n=1 Tax=Paramecium tetraurelia TaxID=5888 RepID=A0BF57_PARTE|nr:uncharacterized protein GSPATT00028209001 [Paramecium tetraurelia]CAK57174.1 unnamed protein product [Paramecium tetraurelia]|eukprot:XP_001424572.1 hypothetical protein (macronuclear) [Paramecium tetraurelia strain d4-2]
MIVTYNNQDYKVGYPKTLSKMKKKLQEQIPEIKERELVIMKVHTKEEKKLIEQFKYQEVVQSYKKNQGPKLKCYILQKLLQSLSFEFSQQKQQHEIDLCKQKNNTLENTALQIDSNQQMTGKLEQFCSSEQQNQQKESVVSGVISEISTFYVEQPLINQNNQEINEKQQYQKEQITESQFDSILNRSQMDRGNNTESNLQTMISKCQICNQKIVQYPYFLSCSHVYHEQCLKEFLINQIKNKGQKLFCHCNKQIIHPCSILETLDLNYYNSKLLDNQLNEIKKTYKCIKRCPNKTCTFFVINTNNQITKSFCPQCLMQVLLV